MNGKNLTLYSGTDQEPYRLFNLDVFEYELNNQMALYGSVPFLVSHTPTQSAGVFFHNSAEMWIDIDYAHTTPKGLTGLVRRLLSVFEDEKKDAKVPQALSHWMVESGIIDLFFVIGPKPKDVFAQYSALTGL